MSGRPPIDVNPVDVAIEMLTAELPGFESRFVDGRDAVGIRGGLPIAAELSHEMVMYPIYRRPVFMSEDARRSMDAHETDEARAIRHARQREALREELAPIISRVTDEIRRRAIDAVGLEPVMRAREERARADGRRQGYGEGRAAGIREGRIEAMREWQEAAERIRDLADEMSKLEESGELDE